MSITPRTEDLRDVGWQVGATLPAQRENGDSFVDGVDHAAVVDGDTLTGYVWFGGWQQIWQVSRATGGVLAGVAEAVAALSGSVSSVRTGTLGAVAEAVSGLSGTVVSPGPTGTLAAQAEAVAAITGKVVVSGQVSATAEAVSALSGTAGSAFDPIADVDWFSAYWANDPNWSNPGDGNALSGADAWDDATGNGHHLDVNTGSPVFRSSDADFGGRSVVDFPGSADLVSDAFTDQGATIEYFVVAKADTHGSYGYLHGVTGHRVGFGGGSGNAYRLFQGSAVDNGVEDTAVHIFNARFGATDELWVDGTQEISGNAGSETLEQIRMGTFSAGGAGNYLDGKIAFAGVNIGALASQTRSDLNTWAPDFYSL